MKTHGTNIPKILWQPTPTVARRSNLVKYLIWLQKNRKQPFLDTVDLSKPLSLPELDKLYENLHAWSVEDMAGFWESLWVYFKIKSSGKYSAVLKGESMPHFRWFEGARLNYAEHIFRKKNSRQPAIIFKNETDPAVAISWAQLENETAAMAQFFKQQGVKAGDRVAAFLPNTPHATVAMLAATAIGAVWSSCSPDFGASSVADRFVQIKPKLLIAVDGYHYGGKAFDKTETVKELCRLIPGIKKVVVVPYLNKKSPLLSLETAVNWETIIATPAPKLTFKRVAFDHPLWILYSSGTTGAPKAITHSHGGNLLEHLKYLTFHNDVKPGERFFWFSTTGWMMWNFIHGAALAGATMVLYDGSPGFPNLNILWDLAEKEGIQHFGTSAPYIVSCMRAGIEPKKSHNLRYLRSIGSTGSPLPPEAFAYVYKKIKRNVWLSSMAGGTDVCTAWVGGNPLLPVYEGEIQCRCLGCAMESWDDNGHSVIGDVGEMVVTKPMPSMPVFFWNDADFSKYTASYFENFPGVWRHGDWLKITDRHTLVILGRSDATLNRQGVRIGTAEIYRAVDTVPEIKDSLIVNIEKPDGSDWMPLFVTMQDGFILDDAIKTRIKTALRTAYSPRHVPDEIIAIPDIPYTISGKKMESPVKKILMGRPVEKSCNVDSMKNPEAIRYFADFYQKMRKN